MPVPIRVALIEDNDVFREALELLLGLNANIEVVASLPDGTAAVETCRRHAPHVVLLDYRLPGPDGLRVAEALQESCPEVAVICLTASASPGEAGALRAAGVVETLMKDVQLDVILAAITRAAGRVVV